ALYADCSGVTCSFAYNDKGEEYGNLPDNCNLCMYSYANDAPVLFTENDSYDLSYCGKMSFNASYGRLTKECITPKE
ncbi:MAG: hypothetical protein ACI4MB_06250, partial [Candidatus Coproplasma sp.]